MAHQAPASSEETFLDIYELMERVEGLHSSTKERALLYLRSLIDTNVDPGAPLYEVIPYLLAVIEGGAWRYHDFLNASHAYIYLFESMKHALEGETNGCKERRSEETEIAENRSEG
jgi:hypothetical protein